MERSPLEVFLAFLRLGLTSFGGPVAHLGYFRAEFVTRRAWLKEPVFADLVALCQFMPGPASSQVGMSIGLLPFWETLRHRTRVQAALRGVNAAVVGVPLAALFTPIWTSAVHARADFGLGLAAFLLLSLWAVPPWLVVVGGAGIASALAALGVVL